MLSARVDANPDNERLSQFFKVPLNANGFFLEAHAKLRPVDFATEGVFVCGSRALPQGRGASAIAQAKAAAARAATVLAQDPIEAEGKTSFVRESRCEACGACVDGVPVPRGRDRRGEERGEDQRRPVQGLRRLRGHLPRLGDRPKGFRDEQILAVLNAVQ